MKKKSKAMLDREEDNLEREPTMAALDDAIASLTAEVANNKTVESSALALINGFAAQLATAAAAATAAGATPAQLKGLADLQASIKANDDDLAAAVSLNTSPPPPPPKV